MNYIIAIDQSTSSTKALLFDEQCHMVARTNVDHQQYYPQTGWVEHDAEEIYQNMIEAIRQLMVSSLHSPLSFHYQSARDRCRLEPPYRQTDSKGCRLAGYTWCRALQTAEERCQDYRDGDPEERLAHRP